MSDKRGCRRELWKEDKKLKIINPQGEEKKIYYSKYTDSIFFSASLSESLSRQRQVLEGTRDM